MDNMRLMSCLARVVAPFVLMTLQNVSDAQPVHECVDAARAEKAVDSLRTPLDIYNWFKKFKWCDDGGIAEGNSEAVARLLVDHWDKLAGLYQLTNTNHEFKAFVMRHIDETIAFDDGKKIYRNATTKCPKYLDEFCAEIAATVSKSERKP